VECATIWRINRRIGNVLAQSRRVLVQVDHQLRKISSRRCELADEELVQARHIHRSLVDGRRHLEDEIVSWRLAEEFECASLVEDQEVRVLYKAEGSVVGNTCRAKSERLIDGPVSEKVVR